MTIKPIRWLSDWKAKRKKRNKQSCQKLTDIGDEQHLTVADLKALSAVLKPKD